MKILNDNMPAEVLRENGESGAGCDFSPVVTDYAVLLERFGLSFSVAGHYLLVGSGVSGSGRLLFVSVVQSQVPLMLGELLPFLSAKNLSFELVKDKQAAVWALSGILGIESFGKVMTVYVPEGADFEGLVQEMSVLLAGFKGPVIPGCMSLGGVLYSVFPAAEVLGVSRRPLSFQQKYIVLSVLKTDVKGWVFKGFYFFGFFRMGKCLIKEGRLNMWSDDAGRDMKDRMEWQQQIHLDLAGKVDVPAVLDLFEEGGNSYLVMEFVKGSTLEKVVMGMLKERSWKGLEAGERRDLLLLLLRVVDIVGRIHVCGYVHRDLTPANFLMDKKGKIYVIDWELAYSLFREFPVPAFLLGSPGFMSPEQLAVQRPAVAEDVYALGGVLIFFFTGLSPVRFPVKDSVQLFEKLFNEVPDTVICGLIVRCFASTAGVRPAVLEIKEALQDLTLTFKGN